jgi:predicted ATPase
LLLSTCPRLKILTTSRESLRIPGEWLYPVPAFQVPQEASSLDVENALRMPALALFAERARAVRPDFALHADNIAAVSTICARLDGLPLAIELIAARMRSMSPEGLLSRMSDQYVMSANGMRAPSARQKTLQDAIDWSYALLSQEEQNLFAYLSVFSGGFTLEAAEAVFSPLFTSKPVSELITSLLDKSLLQYGAAWAREHTESRYTMLMTIQEFARNRLRQAGEETEIRDRHLAYLLALAEQADQQIHGPQQLEWINRLEAERDNFRAAFEWSLSTNRTENAVRFFNSLNWAWHIRGHFSEMAEWFEKIIHLPDLDLFPLLKATAMINIARWEWWKGEGKLTEAHSHLDQSRTICEQLGQEGESQLAWALTWLSHILRMEGTRLVQAASLARNALQLHQKCGNEIGEAFSTLILGVVEVSQDLPSAKQTLLHSLELFHQLGDTWGIARASQFLGAHFLHTEDFEQARTYFEQHLLLEQKLDFRPGLMPALDDLGEIYLVQGDLIRARQMFQESIQISQVYGLTPSYSIYSLSITALAEDDYESARNYSMDYFHHERNQFSEMVACDLFMLQAAVAAGVGQAQRSAKLYGAAQLILDTTEYKYPAYHIDEFERHIQLAREPLAENFESFVQEGRAMTMEQAIDYALTINS